MTEDVGLRLSQIGLVPLYEKPDSVGGPVDAEDQLKAHQTKDTKYALTAGNTISYSSIMNDME